MPKELNFLSQLTGSFALAAAGNATVAMIEAAYRHHRLDWRYINCEVTPERLGDAVRGARAMGWAGFNCSLPHKVAVIQHLDGLGESAAIMRVVNRGVERGAELVRVINDKTPAIAELIVWDRTYKVQPDADVVINATSIGLYPHVDARLDIDVKSLKPGMVVADVVPSPPRTNLITDAEACGCTIVDGLGMLVNQGVISIKYWTGIDVDAAIMRRKLEEIYGV